MNFKLKEVFQGKVVNKAHTINSLLSSTHHQQFQKVWLPTGVRHIS